MSMIEMLKAKGYRVFMRRPTDTYCYFTTQDGKKIGYLQTNPPRACSVHRPNTKTGTGFMADSVDEAINMHCPSWARHHHQDVVKWRDIEHFRSADA